MVLLQGLKITGTVIMFNTLLIRTGFGECVSLIKQIINKYNGL